jgi:hypothetical protein
MALAEILAPVSETLVALAEPIVHTREATVKSTKSAPVEAAKSAAVKPPRPRGNHRPTTAITAMASVGDIRLAERGNAQQRSCDGSQSPSYPGPGSMFA